MPPSTAAKMAAATPANRSQTGALLEERAACLALRPRRRQGVRASVSSNLIFGVEGGFWREKHFRLVTTAATALATILEITRSEERRVGKEWRSRGSP